MSMCQLHTVAHARKAQGNCGRCGAAINPGDAYRWWRGRFTNKYVRCLNPACQPEPWERETNPLRADHMQAEHYAGTVQGFGAGDDFESLEEVTDPLQAAIDSAQAIIDALEARVEGWEGTNLENSYQYEACSTSKDELEDWVSEAEGTISELQSLDDGHTASDVEDILANLPELPELDLGA